MLVEDGKIHPPIHTGRFLRPSLSLERHKLNLVQKNTTPALQTLLLTLAS